MRKSLKTALACGMLALLGISGLLWAWREMVVRKRAAASEVAVSKAIDSGDFLSARSALPGLLDPEVREKKDLEIRTAEVGRALKTRDTDLLRVAMSEPQAAEKLDPALREAAELEMAREALWSGDLERCEDLRGHWKEAAGRPGSWTLLAADLLLARRELEKARVFLEEAKLTGTDDALRHARLALFNAREPWKAMESLDAGLRADPRNADVISFRAQIEEAAGRIADARLDYVAAVLCEPKNPLHRDVLAHFQLRSGEPSSAAETWRDAAEVTGLGVYAFKAWFWSRMGGVPLSKPLPEIRQNGWNDLISELARMPSGALWSPSLEVPLSRIRGAANRPEIVWLRILETLRSRNWHAALEKLEQGFPREAERINPGLSSRLLANLTALDGGDPRVVLTGRDLPSVDGGAHPFLGEFDDWMKRRDGRNDPFTTWLRNPASPVSTLFAHGWHGAALDVGGGAKLAPVEGAPEWFDFGYSRCLLVRDGALAARSWLESLPQRSPAADLTYGEILLATGASDQGLSILSKAAASHGPQAGRAAWTLALAELDRGQSASARHLVETNPELAASTRGREILARAALAEGRREETVRIYQELGEDSTDAMIFLSKDAFARSDWPQARKWTGELARRFPAEPQFRKNLIRIDEAENQGKP